MKSVFTFIDGVIEIFEALLQLRPLVLLTKADTIDPATLLATLAKHKIYRLAIVPSHLATLLQYVEEHEQPRRGADTESEQAPLHSLSRHQRSQRHSLRIIVCDGEVLSPRTVRSTLRLFPNVKVYNIYGTTETCGDNTYVCIENEHQLDDLVDRSNNSNFMDAQSGGGAISSSIHGDSPTGSNPNSQGSLVPIGHPCDNINVYVVSPEGELVEKGNVGEVFVSGIAVANR